MEQIVDRRNQIYQFLKPYMEECFLESFLFSAFCNTEIYLGSLEMRIDISDDGFYLDEQETNIQRDCGCSLSGIAYRPWRGSINTTTI